MRHLHTFIPVIALSTLLALGPFQCGGGRDAGIFKSSNSGETWERKVKIDDKRTILPVNVLDIVVDPNNTDILYLGAKEGGLYKSSNGGEKWEAVKDKNEVLKQRANVYSVAVDPKNSQNIYLGVYQDNYGRVLKSQDGGASFKEVYVVDSQKYAVFKVVVDPYEPQTIYIGTAQGGLLQSTDFGESWKVVRWFEDVISDIVITPTDTRVIYVTVPRRGIFKTVNKGANWIDLSEGLKDFSGALEMETLIIDPLNSSTLYMGSKYGLLRTRDAGASWQKLNLIIPTEGLSVLSVAVDSFNSNIIYVGAGPQIYKSVDGGEHWIIKRLDTTKNAGMIKIDPKDSKIIYIGIRK